MSSPSIEQFTRVDKALDRFWKAIEEVAVPYYLWKTIRSTMTADREFFVAARNDSQFWLPVLHSLQVNKFIALGRIFDKKSNAFSVKRLQRICSKNSEAFSQETFLQRRGWNTCALIGEYENKDEELALGIRMGLTRKEREERIARHYELKTDEIEAIFISLRQSEAMYKNGAKGVRDNIFAHSNFESGDAPGSEFEGVIIGEIERLLDDLHTVYSILWSSLHNGQAPHHIPIKYKPDKSVKNSVASLVGKIKQ